MLTVWSFSDFLDWTWSLLSPWKHLSAGKCLKITTTSLRLSPPGAISSSLRPLSFLLCLSHSSPVIWAQCLNLLVPHLHVPWRISYRRCATSRCQVRAGRLYQPCALWPLGVLLWWLVWCRLLQRSWMVMVTRRSVIGNLEGRVIFIDRFCSAHKAFFPFVTPYRFNHF